MSRGIGIDFGTTNSSIAVARDHGTVETVAFPTETGTTETRVYLHRAVQQMKTELSSELIGTFVFEDHVLEMRGRVKRSSFEAWIEDDLQKIRSCIDRLLAGTNIGNREVDRVFLTGGSSLVPAVRNIFHQRFGADKISSGSEFTSVAKGLALRGSRM